MRKILVYASAITLLATILGAAPATAATTTPGTVTIDYVDSGVTVAPTSVSGAVGDTFTLLNNRNDNNASFISIVNNTGTVSVGGTNCGTETDCKVFDTTSGPKNSVTVTITMGGDTTIRRYLNSGAWSTVGTLTLNAGQPSIPNVDLPIPDYTVEVNGNGGSCVQTQLGPKPKGTWVKVPLAGECYREGYILTGFTTTPSNSSGSWFFPPSASTLLSSDGKIYAQWSMFFAADRVNNACPGNTTQLVTVGQTVTMPAVQTCGAEVLSGWATDPSTGAPAIYKPGQQVAIGENSLTVWGTWAPLDTVNFWCTPTLQIATRAPDASSQVTRGTTIPTPTTCGGKPVFKWNASNAANAKTVTAGAQTIANINDYYHRVTDQTVDITLRPNNGTCTESTITLTWGSEFTGTTCTRPGFRFFGWNSKADGTGTDFADTFVTSNITVFAKWVSKPTVKANWVFKCTSPVGLDPSWNRTEAKYFVTLPAASDCANPPYSLMSFNTKADGTGTVAAPAATVSVNQDTTWFAQWGAPITLNFNQPNGGASCASQTIMVPFGSNFTLPTGGACMIVKSAVDSWTLTPTPTSTATKFAAGTEIPVVTAATLYAQWGPVITLTYQSDGGQCSITSQEMALGSNYTMPSVDNCTKVGYRLDGWSFSANQGRGSTYFFFEPGTTFPAFWDLTFYAQWVSTSHCATAAQINVDWHDCDKRNLNLQSVNLTNANLKNTLLNNSNLANATLYGVNATGANFTNVQAAGVNLSFSNLTGATVFGANFQQAKMNFAVAPGVELNAADWTGAIFTYANLGGANFSQSRVSANFEYANLPSTNFTGSDLTGSAFTMATGNGTNFTNSTLSGVAFNNAVLPRAIFTNANLTNANLSGMNAPGSTFSSTTLTGANLTGANLPSSIFTSVIFNSVSANSANFEGSTFISVNPGSGDFTGAAFTGSNLTGMNFSQATIKKTRFNSTNLTNANLSTRNLTGIDFSGATISGINFRNATTDTIGGGCPAENLYRNSQVTVTSPVLNAPTVRWLWREEVYSKRGSFLRYETRYGDRTWGMDGTTLVIYCPAP